MNAAVKRTLGFDAMANDFTIAMLAFRSERMDGAFEAVKIMGLTHDVNFQRLVVLVSANFTFMPLGLLLIQSFQYPGGAPHGRLQPCDRVRHP